MRSSSLPFGLVAVGALAGAGLALVHCDSAPPLSHGGAPRGGGSAEACIDCHLPTYQATTNPVHPGVMPTTCQDCHGTDAWRPARYPHTEFPLEGAHGRAECTVCHGAPADYTDVLPTECVGCHQADYDRSPYPGHQEFPTTCQDCHSQDAWRPALASGDHEWWPLEGAHDRASCISCHGDPPVYGGQPTECVGCHQADYDGSPLPGHDRFPTTCADCHGVEAWTPATFDHDRYPLEGAHAAARCLSCHGDPPDYENLPTDCLGCHRAERDAAQVSHDGFSTTCTDCHTMTAWQPAAFDHDAFPLDGAHAQATCTSCHGDPPDYDGLPTTCLGCHRDERDAGAMPHDGFSTTCTDCHTTASWQGAAFDHDAFPLDGAHANAECAGCHGDPAVFQGIATECVGCHRADYDGSPYPGHDQFSTTCTNCHTTTAWVPASGGTHPQDRFPLPHHGSECNECHDTNLSDVYMDNVSCIGCHEHSQGNADPDHREVRNYAFEADRPDFCRDCHADGRN